MSEDNTSFSGVLEEFGDLADVVTKRPILQAGVVQVKIVDFKKTDKEKDGKNMETLNVVLETVNTEKEHDTDKEIPPGHKLFEGILLTPTGGWTKEHTLAALARIKEAATGSKAGKFDTEELIGKELTVQLKVAPATDKYEERNEIRKWIPKDA